MVESVCRGKGYPSILEASIDSPLSITQGLNTNPNAMTTRNLPPVDPVGTNGTTARGSGNGNAVTVV